jgi:hypothetical protein
VPERTFTDSEIDAAIEALSEPERFERAQAVVQRAAPQLQRVLGLALEEAGWFEASHDHALAVAAFTDDEQERLTAVRTLLAEEARIGMLIGVAVGYELARELELNNDKGEN